jgi:hypothetical protein
VSQMESVIRQVLKDQDPAPYLGQDLVTFQLAAVDGHAGDRWVAAVDDYVSQYRIAN